MQTALLLLTTALLAGALAAEEVPAFRLAQLEVAGAPVGSQTSSFTLQAVRPAADLPVADGSWARKAAVVSLADATEELVTETLESAKAGALVVVLPAGAPAAPASWPAAEEWLMSAPVDAAVYLTEGSAALREFLATGEGDALTVQVAADAPAAVAAVTATNVYGLLAGADEAATTLAVVAHYDSVAPAVPALPGSGADANGSGVAALMAAARRLADLYATGDARGAVNVLFLLTAGHDFAGAADWLDGADTRLVESLEAVLCLDSLGGEGPLRLHTALSAEAAAEGVFGALDAELVRGASAGWEHDKFAQYRVPAATLSRQASPPGGAGEGFRAADAAAVEQAAQVLGDALVQRAYGGGSAAADDSNDGFVASWLEALAQEPRAVAHMGPDAAFLTRAADALAEFTGDSGKQSYVMRADVVDFAPVQGTLQAYRTKPFIFEVYVLLGALAYLLLLRLALGGRAALTLDGFRETFSEASAAADRMAGEGASGSSASKKKQKKRR